MSYIHRHHCLFPGSCTPCPFVVYRCCFVVFMIRFLIVGRALGDSLTVSDLVHGTVIANMDVEAMSLSVLLRHSCILSLCSYRSGLWSIVIIESPWTMRCCWGRSFFANVCTIASETTSQIVIGIKADAYHVIIAIAELLAHELFHPLGGLVVAAAGLHSGNYERHG